MQVITGATQTCPDASGTKIDAVEPFLISTDTLLGREGFWDWLGNFLG